MMPLMRLAAVVALVASAGCGDNLTGPPLARSEQVVVVAHQDDDHLFMQPDLSDAVRAHTPTTIVYVTAGDANNGLPFARARIEASKAAYGLMLGAPSWDCGWIEVTHHSVLHCRNATEPLSLVFLGLPDGGVSGELAHSLLRLWEGEVHHVVTVADHPATYSRTSVVATVAAIFATTQPEVIRSLELAAIHGDDHSDHMLVGTIAMLASLQAGAAAELLSYRGYDIAREPSTTPPEMFDYVSLPMRAYEACVTSCTGGQCGVTPCDAVDDPRYHNFLSRRYAVAIRQPPLSGVLHAEGGCLVRAGEGVALGACRDVISLQPGGLIAFGDRCLEIEGDGSLGLGMCEPAPNRGFALDDEGHLFSGLPVPAQGLLDVMHNLCIVGDANGLRADLCGAQRDARWDLLQPAISSPRVSSLSGRGRAVRMADLTGDGRADLCFVGTTLGLACSKGDGAGHFAKAVSIHAAGFVVLPESLALGDVDGDGRADACGRDDEGILCATAASGFVAKRWDEAFAAYGPATASDRSLAIVDGRVCGATTNGVICVRDDVEAVLSTWTATNAVNAPAWLAELDGDDLPDWCVATTNGASCGLAAEQHLTDGGVGWAFSNHAIIEGSVASDGAVTDVVRSAIADVSGDGRGDLCVAVHATIACAVSQGHGFGPRRTMLVMPTTAPITAMWLGDLDGDGKADVCADDGTSITCARSP
jgi:LmbE family N-acetylglucosaminyl deacetylase